jgi:NCS1 family nucleobase:cation symporter-1
MAGEHHGPAGAALPTPTTARPEATKERRPMATRDQDTSAVITDDAPAGVQVREGEYGDRLIAVEPGGAEFIPLHERHGRPLQLFWTWTSPNLEFATVFVGVLAVAAFGLSFTQAVLAIVIGSGVGAVTQGLGSAGSP